MSELEPCPFCGGDAEAHTYNTPYNWEVACTSKTCAVQPSTRISMGGRGYEKKDDAVAAWNTRTESPEIAAMRKVVTTSKQLHTAVAFWFEGMNQGVGDHEMKIRHAALGVIENHYMSALAEYEKVKEKPEQPLT